MLYVLIPAVILIIAFMWWRSTSVTRGKRKRDAKILTALQPIIDKLSNKESVSATEVEALARQPQYRPMLYDALRHFERLDLFPAEALTLKSQAAGILAQWMMHPNELQDAPSEIELVDEIEKEFKPGPGKFLVFRFRMPAGHWAAEDGWLLGLAGPFFKDDEPYSAAAFARYSDKHGETTPAELVDWYCSMLVRHSS
jgi:hypothetical protein